MKPLPEFVAGKLAIGGEIDQPVFLHFEFGELFAERFLFFLFKGLHLFERLPYLVSYLCEFLGVELFGGNGPGDCVLDIVEPDTWHCAESALLGCAEVVLICATVSGVLAVYEAAVSTRFFALSAIQQAAKEMKVCAVAVALAVSTIENSLNGKEQFLGDDWFVTSWVEESFVADHTCVVGVAEDHGQLTGRQRSRGAF